MSLTSVFYRWGWGAPVGGLVHAHPRETPFSAQRSRAGLHVSALQWCLQKFSVVLFSVMNAANVSTLQGQAAESGREASRCGVWAEVSAQQTWCVVASLLWTCCYTHFLFTHTSYHWKNEYTNNFISDSFSEKDWTEEDKGREQELMAELVTIIEQRNQIVNNMDQDRQR